MENDNKDHNQIELEHLTNQVELLANPIRFYGLRVKLLARQNRNEIIYQSFGAGYVVAINLCSIFSDAVYFRQSEQFSDIAFKSYVTPYFLLAMATSLTFIGLDYLMQRAHKKELSKLENWIEKEELIFQHGRANKN